MVNVNAPLVLVEPDCNAVPVVAGATRNSTVMPLSAELFDAIRTVTGMLPGEAATAFAVTMRFGAFGVPSTNVCVPTADARVQIIVN